MIKKLGSIILILLVTALVMWLYLANRFEKMVTEELLPIIRDNDSMILADLDSVKISKYQFKVSVNNLVLLPNIKYSNIHSDKATIYYNPFGDKITLCFNGDKLSIGSDNLAIYTTNAGQKITFNRSLLTSNLNDIKISLSSKDASFYFASDDNFISRPAKSDIDFSSTLDADVYTIDFSLNSDQIDINPESKYLELLVEEILAENSINDPALSKYLDSIFANITNGCKIYKETGAVDYKTKYSIKINKKQIADILAVLKDKKNIVQLLESIKNDNYSLSFQEKIGNSFKTDARNFDLNGNEGKIHLKVDVSCKSDYTDEQKVKIAPLFNNAMLDRLLKDYGVKSDKIELADFENTSQALLNISKANLNIDLTTDIKTNKSEYVLNFDLNDFNTNFSGDLDDRKLTSSISIHTPKIFINGATNFYNNMRPIFDKLLVSNIKAQEDYKKFDQFVENLNDNGFAAISALHSGSELKENETLTANVIFNPMAFEFKLNDKNIMDLLTDERILNFLKAMDDKENKVEGQSDIDVITDPIEVLQDQILNSAE